MPKAIAATGTIKGSTQASLFAPDNFSVKNTCRIAHHDSPLSQTGVILIGDAHSIVLPQTAARIRSSRMKREELARGLARQNHISSAQARDQVDEMVHKILKALREGQPVEVPGVGRLLSKPAAPRSKPSARPARAGKE